VTGFQLARLSLIRRWPATIIAVAALALVTFCSSLLISLLLTLGDPLAGIQTGCQLIVGPKSSHLGLLLRSNLMWERSDDIIPYTLHRPLRRDARVREVIPLYTFGEHEGQPLVGTGEEYLSLRFGSDAPVMTKGRWFARPGEAVLGRAAARSLGLKPGDEFRVSVSPSGYEEPEPLWTRDLTVTGVVDHGGRPMDSAILVDLETGWEYYRLALAGGWARNTQDEQAVTYFLVSIGEENIERALGLFHRQTVAQAVELDRELEQVRRLMGRGRMAAAGVCGAIILLAAFSLATLVNARFEVLRPDLGMLRALGYNRLALASWIFWEALLIAVAAVAVGAAAEGAVLRAIDIPTFMQFPGREIAWPTLWNAGVWLAVLGSSGLATVFPLLRLYSTDAHLALRSC